MQCVLYECQLPAHCARVCRLCLLFRMSGILRTVKKNLADVFAYQPSEGTAPLPLRFLHAIAAHSTAGE
jgi:hypothetical protein